MRTFIFIYNANSGLGNVLLDMSHKIFSPRTYPCHLCDITYGVFTENKIWKDFRMTTDFDLVFLHIDEFETAYPNEKFEYPVILTKIDGDLKEYMKARQINSLKSVEELIASIH